MKEERKWCVYCHTNKINGKKYIGITSTNPNKRWGNNGIKYKGQLFYKAIVKYGWDNFNHEILESDLYEKDAKEKEKYYIEKNNTYVGTKDCMGYNVTRGGDGAVGYVASEEAKKKISDWHKGKPVWNKGKRYNLPSSSEYLKKKWKDNEYREHMINGFKNKKLSEDTKLKISKNNARKRHIYQIDKNDFHIINEYESIVEAIKHISRNENKAHSSSISSCLKNKVSESYGYKWIEVNDYKNKTEMYYNIINSKPLFNTVLCISKSDFRIIKKYNNTKELMIDYSKNEINKIKQICIGNYLSDFNGFIWCYYEQYNSTKHKYYKNFIHQIDVNTNKIINTFSSFRDANDFLGIRRYSYKLRDCINSDKILYGYKWEYAEGYDRIGEI